VLHQAAGRFGAGDQLGDPALRQVMDAGTLGGSEQGSIVIDAHRWISRKLW
jgi:hypothetical protein